MRLLAAVLFGLCTSSCYLDDTCQYLIGCTDTSGSSQGGSGGAGGACDSFDLCDSRVEIFHTPGAPIPTSTPANAVAHLAIIDDAGARVHLGPASTKSNCYFVWDKPDNLFHMMVGCELEPARSFDFFYWKRQNGGAGGSGTVEENPRHIHFDKDAGQICENVCSTSSPGECLSEGAGGNGGMRCDAVVQRFESVCMNQKCTIYFELTGETTPVIEKFALRHGPDEMFPLNPQSGESADAVFVDCPTPAVSCN